MSKEYMFEFSGTKKDFLDVLNSYNNTTYDGKKRFYYLDEFMITRTDEVIHFGVERAGHSGGYWFIPEITECNGKTVFYGKLKYIGPENNSENESAFKRCIDNIGEWLLNILLAPFVLLLLVFFSIYAFFEWVIKKIRRLPTAKLKTTEDKLFYLMENRLGCVRK